jgi:hypothetical protein
VHLLTKRAHHHLDDMEVQRWTVMGLEWLRGRGEETSSEDVGHALFKRARARCFRAFFKGAAATKVNSNIVVWYQTKVSRL